MSNPAKAIGDFNICKDSADQFYSIAMWCQGNDIGDLISSFYPFAVNISFSCELYLKAIMIKRSSLSEFQKGHNLLLLYRALDANDQAALEKEFSTQYSAKTIEDFLDENQEVFIDWRYAMEQKVTLDISGFLAFGEALKKYISKI